MLTVEIDNRSGQAVDEGAAVELACRVLRAEGIPRALGDVVLCPAVVGDEWRRPLTHGLLHLLGYDHGEEMERREEELR